MKPHSEQNRYMPSEDLDKLSKNSSSHFLTFLTGTLQCTYRLALGVNNNMYRKQYVCFLHLVECDVTCDVGYALSTSLTLGSCHLHSYAAIELQK